MFLDITSVMYFSVLCFLIGIILSVFKYVQTKRKNSPYLWLLFFYIAVIIAYVVLLNRSYTNIWISSHISYSLIFIGILSILHSIQKLYQQNIPFYFHIVVYVLFIFSSIYFTYNSPDAAIRLVIFSVVALLYFSLMLRMLLITKEKSHRILLYSLYFINLNFLMTILITIFNYKPAISILDLPALGINMMLLGIFSVVFWFGIYEVHEYFVTPKNDQNDIDNSFYKLYMGIPMASLMLDDKLVVVHCNQKCFDLFGMKQAVDIELTSLLGEIGDTLANQLNDLDDSCMLSDYHFVRKTKNGSQHINVILQCVASTPGIRYILFFEDITNRLNQSRTLKQYELLLEGTRGVSLIGFWEIPVGKGIIIGDSFAKDIYEISDEKKELSLQTVQSLVLPQYRPVMDQALMELIEHNTPYDVQFEIITKSGKVKHIHSQAFLIDDHGSKKVLGMIQDVTSFVSYQREIEYMKHHDSLTGLLNRDVFETLLKESEDVENLPITILVSDLDNLSAINVQFGYDFGNKILIESARIFEAVFTKSAIIARIGEDEFGVILTHTDDHKVEEYLTNIEEEFHRRFSSAGEHKINWSFGFATQRSITQSIQDVFAKASTQLEKYKVYYNQVNQTKSIDAIMKTLNEKDPLSDIHSTRVAHFSKKLALAYGMSSNKAAEVETAALLHDIGKILIDNSILLSSDRLSDEEYEIMKRHPITGYKIINAIPEMKDISKIILAHHEWVNGQGYPYHIKGDNIPLESKIIAIADAYDAMTGQRNYRSAYVKEEAIMELLENRGTQFDTELVNVFVDMILEKKPN